MNFISQIIDEVVESVVEERWLPVTDYEGLYEVSSLGRFKSFHKFKDGKILKLSPDKDGYIRVSLSKKKVIKYDRLHRLVLQAFNPTEEELVCDHENHIKNDNRLVNLRWATISQNTRYQSKRDDCTSQYIGVCNVSNSTRGKPWLTTCRINNKVFRIGTFDTEEEAGKAYNDFVITKNLQDFTILNKF